MQITNTEVSGAVVLSISGSVDATTVAEFDDEWKKTFDEGTKKLVVDLSGIEYMSSAGLRGILMLAKTAKAKGVAVAFCGMNGMVADIFKLSGFLSILAVYPDVETAAGALQ